MLSELNASEYNPRMISPDQMRRLKSSIMEHTNTLADWKTSDGLRMATTITVNRNGNRIVGGHMRVEALRALGQDWIHCADITWVDIVPGSAAEKALNVALNNREMQGDWDAAKLSQVLSEIKFENAAMYDAMEFDLLEALAPTDPARGGATGKTDPDDVPEIPEPAVSVEGEVYRLADHVLLCGDATDRRAVSRLLGGEKADALVTDPPYNVGYVGKTSAALEIKNDSMNEADYRRFLARAFSAAMENMAGGAAFYVWHADGHALTVRLAARDAGMEIRQALVWVKSGLVIGRQDWHWRHEPCLYGWKAGAAHKWRGGRDRSTVLEYAKPSRCGEHPTMKPVALMEDLIEASTDSGEKVLDVFGGSGSTLIAAERLGRRAYIAELDTGYCDVIRRRFAEYVYGEGCDWRSLTPAG